MLLERAGPLRVVSGLLSAARGGSGGLLVFEGPAGIGKTALLDAIARSASGVRVSRAAPTALERLFAFGALRRLVGEPRAARGPAAAAARALGAAGTGAASATHAVLYGLMWMLADAAQETPLLWLLDDAQWADAGSLSFLLYAASRLKELPVAIVLAARPPPGELLGQLPALPLAPLSPDATETLLARSLGSGPARDRAEEAFQATGGNPYLVEQLAGGWRDGVPATSALRRSVAHRVQAAGPAAVRLAEALAVLGGARVELHVGAELAGLDLHEAATAADALRAADLLAADATLSFAHPLVREALYEAIGPSRRALAHRSAAAALDRLGAKPDTIAAHLLVATPAGEPATVATLRAAAERTLARGAPEGAIELLRRAVAEPPPPAERGAVLHELGAAEAAACDPAAERNLRAALDCGAIDAALTLGRLLIMNGHGEEAIRVLAGARERVPAGSALRLRIEAEWLAAARTQPGSHGAPRAAAVSERPELEGATAHERLLLASLAYEACAVGGAASIVRSLAGRALAGGQLLRDEGPDCTIAYFAIAALTYTGHLDDALAALDDALEQTRRCGSLAGYAFARAWRADVRARSGAAGQAEADATDALALAAEHDLQVVVPLALMTLVSGLIDGGRVTEAQERLEAHGLLGELPRAGLFAGVWHARGRLRASEGRHAEAGADFLAAGEALLAAGVTTPAIVPWRSDAALVLTDKRRAAALVAEELALARKQGAPRPLGIALRARALLRGGEGLADALEPLRQSPVELARTLIALGAAQLRDGALEEGRASLREALDLADRHGATGLADDAHARLIEAGSRPRRRRLRGLEALTPAELRVARMAAGGHSNREIAAELFLTLKTVETHLSRVYDKLAVGRAELAAQLANRRG